MIIAVLPGFPFSLRAVADIQKPRQQRLKRGRMRKGELGLNSPAQPARRATTSAAQSRVGPGTHVVTITKSGFGVNPRNPSVSFGWPRGFVQQRSFGCERGNGVTACHRRGDGDRVEKPLEDSEGRVVGWVFRGGIGCRSIHWVFKGRRAKAAIEVRAANCRNDSRFATGAAQYCARDGPACRAR